MNKFNISLNRTCQILDDNKSYKVLKVWTPFIIHRKYYAKFMKDFSEMFGEGGDDLKLDNKILRLEIWNEAYNIIPSLLALINAGDVPQEAYDFIKTNYHVQDADLIEIVEYLIREQKRLITKFKQLKPAEDDKEKVTFKFSDIIASVEETLKISIDRNQSIYMFHSQYNRASEVIKKLSNGTN